MLNMETKQAIVYVRASTNEAKQSNSHQMQLHSISEFAKSHDYNIVKVFAEYASGTLDERPVFAEVLAYAAEHDCYILAYRLDRVSRSLTIFNQLNPHLHRLRFSTMGDTEINLIVISVLLSMAHAESNSNSQRVKQAYKTLKANNDVVNWGIPITNEVRVKGLAVRQQNAQEFNQYILKVVNDLKLAGYSTSEIPNRLNQLHLFTRRGKKWSYHNLLRIIRNT
jgi:DNA invertase Pin-like site-specific DNA recombinase